MKHERELWFGGPDTDRVQRTSERAGGLAGRPKGAGSVAGSLVWMSWDVAGCAAKESIGIWGNRFSEKMLVLLWAHADLSLSPFHLADDVSCLLWDLGFAQRPQ